MERTGRNLLIINHVFWPDNHNTARHISELSSELASRSFDVTVLTCNRSVIDPKRKFTPKTGVWGNVKFRRVYIPPFNIKNNAQRLLASAWLILSWISCLPRIGNFDAIIIGTNPPFAYLMVPFIRLLKRRSKIILWGHDLYPEAIIAAGGKIWKLGGEIIKPVARYCHRLIDVIVDIGPCMREIYNSYNHKARKITLTPWSFIEPDEILKPHIDTRLKLFGDAKITLLYSGTLGNAHEFDNFLQLARELRKREANVAFCFAGFGNRFEEIQKQVTEEDNNISFGSFLNSDEDLAKRFSSADFMMISLRENWTGISVPSKFFGAIASGKAVLFSGSVDSAINKWIVQYKSGIHLSKENITSVADMLCNLTNDPGFLNEYYHNSFNAYRKYFSKKVVCDKWAMMLIEETNPGRNAGTGV